MKKTIKLLPCLCGTIPEIKYSNYLNIDCYWVECYNEKCPVQPTLRNYARRNTAIKSWNRWVANGVKRLAKIIEEQDK